MLKKRTGLLSLVVFLAVMVFPLNASAMTYTYRWTPNGWQLVSTSPSPTQSSNTYYRVQSGDTLFRIAQHFGTTVNELIRINRLTSTAIYPGQLLLVPRRPATVPSPAPAPQPVPQPVPSPAPAPQPEQPVSGLTQAEQRMLELVNFERTSRGLRALQLDMQLVRLARLKSQDMINLGYFAHQSPTYGSPFDMMRAAGVTYKTAGENLAGAPTVDRAHTGLMNSTGHRANILNAGYTHIGIGAVSGGPYGMMFTQLFVGR